eukprot:1196393-Rhodomonas_salina.2
MTLALFSDHIHWQRNRPGIAQFKLEHQFALFKSNLTSESKFRAVAAPRRQLPTPGHSASASDCQPECQ